MTVYRLECGHLRVAGTRRQSLFYCQTCRRRVRSVEEVASQGAFSIWLGRLSKAELRRLTSTLRALEGVSIEGQGKGGIALVLEAPTVEALRKLSEEIQQWEEVIDLQLNYLNWEEL